MSDLTEFLLARIADREVVARDMQDQARLGRPFFDVDSLAGGTGIRELIDPARVLAECEAKRRIVYANCPPGDDRRVATMRWLAVPYADHPDYRQEWKP